MCVCDTLKVFAALLLPFCVRSLMCVTGIASGRSFGDNKFVSARAPPPDRRDIGRAGWMFLHSFASKVGIAPPSHDCSLDADMGCRVSRWMGAFGRLYPCVTCRPGLLEALIKDPPNVGSRGEFAVWTCELHNRVNKSVGLPQYPCVTQELLEFGNW